MQKFFLILVAGLFVSSPIVLQASDEPFIFQTPRLNFELPSIMLDFRPVVRVLTTPWRLLAFIKEQIDQAPKQIAALFFEKRISNFQLPISKQIQNSNDQILQPVIARSDSDEAIPNTRYKIHNTKYKRDHPRDCYAEKRG